MEKGVEVLTTGRYEIGAFIGNGGTYNMDWLDDSITYTPQSDWFAKMYDDTSMCGINDWEKNVSRDVTGLDQCGERTTPGSRYLDLIAVDGDKLLLGKYPENYDGTVRPQALDTDVMYFRIND